jgi:hypothetical protein
LFSGGTGNIVIVRLLRLSAAGIDHPHKSIWAPHRITRYEWNSGIVCKEIATEHDIEDTSQLLGFGTDASGVDLASARL